MSSRYIDYGALAAIDEILPAGDAPQKTLDAYLRAAMFEACCTDRADIVELLLDMGASVDETYRSCDPPLDVAARHNAASAIDVLLARGAHPNRSLLDAVALGHPEAVAALLRSGANVWESFYGFASIVDVAGIACDVRDSTGNQLILEALIADL